MHAMQRHMSVGQAALMQCLKPYLRHASFTAAPHPSVSMQKQREPSNESLVHMPTCRRAGKEGTGKE